MQSFLISIAIITCLFAVAYSIGKLVFRSKSPSMYNQTKVNTRQLELHDNPDVEHQTYNLNYMVNRDELHHKYGVLNEESVEMVETSD